MSEHVAGEPVEPSNNSEPTIYKSRRLTGNSVLRKAVAGLMLTVAFGIGQYITRQGNVKAANEAEVSQFNKQKDSGLMCLRQAVLFEAGTTYSSTPESVGKYLGILGGSKTETIENGKELLVKKPIVTNQGGNTLYGFDPEVTVDKSGAIKPSTENISEAIVWIKAANPHKGTAAEDSLINGLSLGNTPASGDLQKCRVLGGQILASADGSAAAYGNIMPAGTTAITSKILDGNS